MKFSVVDVPTDLQFIKGILSRNGYDDIVSNFIIEGDTASADFGEVHSVLWHLSVTAYSSNDGPLYFGETDINILFGQNNVVYLRSDPLAGNLTVVVTWGNNDTLYCAIYVDSNNNGYEDGSKLEPYNTIQEAVNNYGLGDTICVTGGTYYENVLIDDNNSGIILLGGYNSTDWSRDIE